MTFEDWKREQYKDQSTEERMEFVEHLHTFPEYFRKAFEAGRNADVHTDNSKVIENLEKELENERKINEEIKARFVKCNTCTQEMKDKCLMFTENLCEGERCEELVDIMSLVEKRESDDKLKLAKDIIKKLISNAPDTYSGTDIELQQSKMFAFHNAINEAEEFIKE